MKPGSYRPLPLLSLGPKVPKKCWLGTRSCPTSRNQLHLFASPEHRVMLGPRRVIEHAWQLGWVPVPTQQAKYSHIPILSIYERLFNMQARKAEIRQNKLIKQVFFTMQFYDVL